MRPNGTQETGIIAIDPTDIFISDVLVSGFELSGILIVTPRSVSIVDSQISDTVRGDGVRISQDGQSRVSLQRLVVSRNGGDGIQLNQRSISTVIEDSLVEENSEAGIQIEGFDTGSLNIRRNCIRRNTSEVVFSWTVPWHDR